MGVFSKSIVHEQRLKVKTIIEKIEELSPKEETSLEYENFSGRNMPPL